MNNTISEMKTAVTSAAVTIAALCAAPAHAAFFDVPLDGTFGDTYTGVSALLTFDFQPTATGYDLDLTIENTTPSTFTSASLVGFGFDMPASVTDFTYDPRTTNLEQALRNLSMPPAPAFDFCASTSGRCVNGFPASGIGIGESSMVSFNIISTATSAEQLADQFRSLYQGLVQVEPDQYRPDLVVLAARFQAIDGPGVQGGSDKITGIPHSNDPDTVPGPLPVLGVAATWSWARRLRRRIGK